MNTVEFLRHVLPSQGYYASIVINEGGGPRQGFFDNIDALANAVSKLSAGGNNVYYAVSSFADKRGGRKQDNVAYTRALFLDVDCGATKPFADWREGLRHVGGFIQENNLPKPMIVLSGNGLHVYWVFDRDLEPTEWRPLADALKRVMPAIYDRSVPADSARVLRAAGTINPKGGNEVRVLINAPTITVEDMRAVLKVSEPQAPQIVQRTNSSLLSNLAVQREFPPTNPDVVVTKCAQIAWAVNNQEDVLEPMWYAVMGVAAFCANPQETAIAWSKNHPGYDEAKTLNKLAHWQRAASGPTTCARFAQDRPNGCKGCIFKDSISSPAMLGLQYAETSIAEDAPDDLAKLVPLPKNYKRVDGGIKINMDGTDIDVCSFDIYPVGYGRDETLGYETVRYRWNRPHAGWQPLSFRQAYLADGSREFSQVIADQGIVLSHKKQTEKFQYMLRSYMDELRKLRSMTNLFATMGWKEDFTQFLIGDTLYKRNPDGSVTEESVTVASQTTRLVSEMYTTSGTADEWAAFTSLLEKANMPYHMFALMVSMSAPLYAFTGLKGITVNLYGPTGAGKTLAQYFQQSIWGDPTQLHYSAKFTQNALYARMGLYNNLPMTIDETTMLPAKDIGDFLYSVSQGQEKARLSKASEERDRKTWATVVTTSANKSMSTALVASGLETDAQIMRLLEITMTPHPLFTRNTKAGQQIYEFVTTHYGAVGRRLARHFVELGEAALRAMIAHHKEQFYKQYNAIFSGNERFWEQNIVLADFMGKMATDLGLIQFDYTKGTSAVLTQIGAMRKAVVESTSDAFDVLAEYLNENADATVTVMHTGSDKRQPDLNRMPRGEVRVRFDIYRPTHAAAFERGTVLLDRKHFKTWLSLKGADYRSVMREVAEQGVDATPKNNKAYLGKDTPIRLGQQYVVGVNLAHPRLIGILTDMDDAVTQTALGGLSVVQGGRP